MSSLGKRRADLGEVDPAGSRQLGRRSTVEITDDRIVVGTASGDVIAFDHRLDQQWHSTDGSASLVASAALDGNTLVGERGPAGSIRCYETETGDLRWAYDTSADIGEPQQETRFFLPFIADIVTDGDRWYVAARRYERVEESRTFRSVVYAVDQDGTIAWRYETDASPISLDAGQERLAVAYNRCPGDHQCGLVVLDSETGAERLTWDPGTPGGRRVRDVSLLPDGVVVASHGDYCGYRLDDRGGECWRLPLATPEFIDGETVYAYPNHVHATEAGLVFVTGNTYPEDGRETEARHPNEHAALGVTPSGDRTWQASVDGFTHTIATSGDRVAVPGAQHFRDRDATAHGLGLFDVAGGPVRTTDASGVVTATALDTDLVGCVEEPVAYHDDEQVRGSYRLRIENC